MSGFDPFEESGFFGADYAVGCPPGWMVTADALYWNRQGDGGNSLSTANLIGDFDYDLAGRVSINRRYDCLIGWEIAFTGPFEWNQTGQAVGAGLNTVLIPNGVNLSAFNNGVNHQESYTSQFHSVEFNQKWWGWDVLSTTAGVRYIGVQEDYQFSSTNNVAQFGQLNVDTNNYLVGGQLGVDFRYPIGRVASTVKLRGSMYANIADSSVLLTNAGATQINTSDNDINFAAMLEMGYYFSYYLTPRLSVRAGYEISWLYGLALAPSQVGDVVSPVTGNPLDGNDDLFFYGGVAGVEYTW